jgi:hypothetical protein
MTTTIEATFDGEVFRPTEPVALQPNTSVRLTVETTAPPASQEEPGLKKGKPYSFLDTLKSIRIEGPPDWSANVDKYLYGDLHDEGSDGDA